jgi:hypothetical protein
VLAAARARNSAFSERAVDLFGGLRIEWPNTLSGGNHAAKLVHRRDRRGRGHALHRVLRRRRRAAGYRGAGGTGGGSSTTTSTTGATATGTTATSSGTGGAGTGGGGPCASAPVLDLGSSVDGTLAKTGQEDYYRISGQKGWAIQLDIDAQYLGMADYDPTYIDSVITVFDEKGVQVAQNNDPIEYTTNDSRLYTILPADGDYCVRVAECWSVIANPGSSCASPKDKTTTAYTLGARQLLDDPGQPATADLEKGNDAASATAIDYVKTDQRTDLTGLRKRERVPRRGPPPPAGHPERDPDAGAAHMSGSRVTFLFR